MPNFPFLLHLLYFYVFVFFFSLYIIYIYITLKERTTLPTILSCSQFIYLFKKRGILMTKHSNLPSSFHPPWHVSTKLEDKCHSFCRDQCSFRLYPLDNHIYSLIRSPLKGSVYRDHADIQYPQNNALRPSAKISLPLESELHMPNDTYTVSKLKQTHTSKYKPGASPHLS